jgi:hypothetical protein
MVENVQLNESDVGQLLNPLVHLPVFKYSSRLTFPDTGQSIGQMDKRIAFPLMITPSPIFPEEPFWTERGPVGQMVTVQHRRQFRSLQEERKNAPTVRQVALASILYFWKVGYPLFEDTFVITSSFSKKWKRFALVGYHRWSGIYVTLHYDPPPDKIIALHDI